MLSRNFGFRVTPDAQGLECRKGVGLEGSREGGFASLRIFWVGDFSLHNVGISDFWFCG